LLVNNRKAVGAMFHENVYFGLVQNLLTFPGWRGETEDGLEISRRLLSDPFFEAVEIGWIANPEYRKLIRKWIAGSGKEVTYCCGPVAFGEGLDLNSRDEAIREKSVARLKQLADDAADFGAKVLVISSGANVEPTKRGEAFRFLTDSVGRLCDFCREINPDKPLVVSVELFDWEIDKKLLLGPVDDAVRFAERMVKNHSNFSLTLDLSHLPMMGLTPETAVPLCMPFLQHVHVGNCVVKDPKHPKYGDKHPLFGIEGGETGRRELQEFLKVLGANGYDKKRVPTRRPVVITEVIASPGENVFDVVENIKAALKK
jgi:sugar phosphate isomerase/epimerase